jgi:hypothetical protein
LRAVEQLGLSIRIEAGQGQSKVVILQHIEFQPSISDYQPLFSSMRLSAIIKAHRWIGLR